MFHATGLTGWQRVVADRQATGEPIVPFSESPPANPVDPVQQQEVAKRGDSVAEIFRSLQEIQNRLAELEGSVEKEQSIESGDESEE